MTGRVGFQRLFQLEDALEADDPILLRVLPKIPGTQWLMLVALARNWKHVDFLEDVSVQGRNDGLREMLIEAYRVALDGLFDEHGGLRRAHQKRERILQGRLKGQLQVSQYLQNIAQGQLNDVPCRFSELRLDNLPNRGLYRALRVAQRLERGFAVDGSLRENHNDDYPEFSEIEARFGGVEDRRVVASDLSNLRLPDAFEGYEQSGSLPLAELLLERTSLSDEAGDHQVSGFHVKLWRIYEHAFARVMAKHVGRPVGEIAQTEWSYRVEEQNASGGGTFRPDIYIPADPQSGRAAIVADTKWKFGMEDSQSSRDEAGDASEKVADTGDLEVSVKNADIYQVAAYTQIAAAQNNDDAVGFLIYPTRNDESEPKTVMQGDYRLPVRLVPWNVTQNPAKSGREIARALCDVASDARNFSNPPEKKVTSDVSVA